MGITSIEWTATQNPDGTVTPGYTFNCWRGCSKVSEGCKFCYAETMAKRNPAVLGVWGPEGKRVIASEAMWKEPLKWERAAAKAGERRRVFCASMADVFEDRPELVAPRERLFQLIADTPNLDWLLLTKRPENVLRMTYDAWCLPVPGHVSQNEGDGRHWHWPSNVWLGTSVESQQTADERIPLLLQAPAVVRFLSCEPLLGPIEFSDVSRRSDAVQVLGQRALSGISWVIAGGESGHHARPCEVAWIRSIVRQCKASGTACFVKQLGAKPVCEQHFSDASRFFENQWGFPPSLSNQIEECKFKLSDPKGGSMDEWPADLRVRDFPTVEVHS